MTQTEAETQDAQKRPEARAWLVLLTRPTYLPGVIVLGHSLKKVGSAYPLIVVVTPGLPQYAVDALHTAGLRTRVIEPVRPREKVKVVAERFEDTWTKLGVFGLDEYKKAVLLDGDMMLVRNMDDLFTIPLPGPDWIAANHACVCNLERSEWAPEDWREENCAYTPLSHPSALRHPTPITPTSPRTHTLLNSGLILFHPSATTFAAMLDFLHTSPLISTFSFPDQDFLAEFFRGRWMPLGWQYNAIKTMRHWHSAMWRDDEVRNVHYIVDKPWNVRKGEAGEDEEVHGWWWDEMEEWIAGMEERGEKGWAAVETMMPFSSRHYGL
ncbi:nucleotide-diphospho-sugar transferase, partial [Geopyxis carbonaria]